MYRKNAWNLTETELKAVEDFSKAYMEFLDRGKTERECTQEAVSAAKAKGYLDLDEVIAKSASLKPGDRVYKAHMGKSFMAFIIGNEPLEKGLAILGAHIDSPRLDIKQNPVYEDENIAYLDTHYYGGIKKYQWLTIPLAIHGVFVKKDGSLVSVSIGEKESDPVFYISDLLPHLAQEQMAKTAGKLVEGEALNLIIGSKPEAEKDGESAKDAVKANVLAILKQEYGVEEEDFVSAELEIVPAGKARDLGFDRSMILGYGHDDRVCAYPSMMALLNYEGTPDHTLCAILTDKEEIGSVGATGMGSRYFINTVSELINCTTSYSELKVKRAMQNSRMLSSDVSAAFDPAFASVFEKKNAGFLGMGVCFNKYTGRGGKSGASDANAEFVALVRRIMDDHNVAYHTCEIGRVDAGGGGTIAYLCAQYGMNVLDCGVPVLSMHAPYEVVSKVDVYQTYRCYCAFLQDAYK